MRFGLKEEKGFTLIEVLAAIVILAIVSLVLTSYFINAMSYSKSNQNKTIMVNLARNALFYMQKQDFDGVKKIYVDQAANGAASGANAITADTPSSGFTGSLASVLHPTVNGIAYQIRVVYQPEIWDEQPQPSSPGGAADIDQTSSRAYLLPVKVQVRREDAGGQPDYNVEVEGYITDERIR
ncbi:hypothetical protein D3C75_306320 [compost metagenome]